jgi:hypothetical protein
MYFFTVGAMFKNEEHCIQEWIEHYIHQGAEHFYLVNDNSTDNSVEKLKIYIERGLITLYEIHSNQKKELRYQRYIYNRFLLPHINHKDTKWLLVCDLDEFVWSPIFNTLTKFLSDYVYPLAQVQITPTLFGSNHLEKQPKSLVQGFTKRTKELPTKCGTYKYFINSDYKYISLQVHHATPENSEYLKSNYFMIVDSKFIRLNHYICQSEEIWRNVKCIRGDADGYLQRDMELFNSYNIYANEVDDYELAEINKNLSY